MTRQNIPSGSPYERSIGFSRAVRMGDRIAVSGTAPIAIDGSVAYPGDVYRQTRRCLEIIQEAVEAAGGRMADVIRTRVYLKDADGWQAAAQAHGEIFGEIRPACTFVEISRLIDPGWLVEIEAECVVIDAHRQAAVAHDR
jgi:enamine deaminase RidA (YjgF/YER057c/UK114 family)